MKIEGVETFNQEGIVIVCPHLGMNEDTTTIVSYPSAQNKCHHCNPPAAPSYIHQRNYCLSDRYRHCEVYLSDGSGGMPNQLILKERITFQKEKHYWVWLAPLLIVLAIAVIFFLRENLSAFFKPASPQPQSTVIAINPTPISIINIDVPTLELLPMADTPTSSIPATPTSEPTPTPTEIRTPNSLETLIGSENEFIIHKVAAGESVGYLARKHNTSEYAIRSVNYLLYTPLWVDAIIVIPRNITDVIEFPSFEPYEVDRAGLTLAEVAEILEVDLEKLALYNELEPETELYIGEWLLIPRPRTYW